MRKTKQTDNRKRKNLHPSKMLHVTSFGLRVTSSPNLPTQLTQLKILIHY